jgi:hypothetical protein
MIDPKSEPFRRLHSAMPMSQRASHFVGVAVMVNQQIAI